MNKQRRKHSAEFNGQVVLEAVLGVKTVSEMTAHY